MKHPLPTLDRLKVFEAAGRHLSFSRAANELCITKGAVSHQIRALESELGLVLFKRSPRQVLLSDSGQLLLQDISRLFAELEKSLGQLRAAANAPSVTIGATTYVAARWLSSRVAGFNDVFPGISVQLQHPVNDAEFDLSAVDFAIRWDVCNGHIDECRLRELPMPLFPVASSALLKRYGFGPGRRLPQDVLLLCEDRELDLWQAWAGYELQNPRRIISDANVRVQAAIDGQGLILADDLMRTEIENGLLSAPCNHRLTGYGYVITRASPAVSEGATSLLGWLLG